MINFRYHIVSITAVFLALGIGTALGSTFLDGPTVDLLNRNIRSAEARIEATQAENRELARFDEQTRARDLSLLVDGSERLVGGILADQPTLVIVGPGVEDATATGVRQILQASGADLRATVTLRDPFLFDGDVDEDLAEDLGIEPLGPGALRAEVYQRLIAALAAAGAPAPAEEGPDVGPPEGPGDPDDDGDDADDQEPGGAGATDPPPAEEGGPDAGEDGPQEAIGAQPAPEAGGPDGTQPEIVTILIEREYLSVDPWGGRDPEAAVLETTGYRYVIVTSTDADADQVEVMARLLPTGTPDDALPAVVVAPTSPEPVDDEPPLVDLVGRVRADDDLRAIYATVDDVETFSGLVATVFVLADLDVAPAGHYGQADGAQAVLPPAP